jgi:hypothetical protein
MQRALPFLNALFILALAVFGAVTDEPYWRANGHLPWTYDYVYFTALALNGPSGVLAELLSRSLSSNNETQYVLQYLLWTCLAPLQWWLYRQLALLSHSSRPGRLFVLVGAVLVFVGGAIGAKAGWDSGHRPAYEEFIDQYFWFVRVASLALAGGIQLLYAFLTVTPISPNLRLPAH